MDARRVNWVDTPHWIVMPGFRPGIHEFAAKKLVDAKAKPWHDY
jgi:hypothetical protein